MRRISDGTSSEDEKDIRTDTACHSDTGIYKVVRAWRLQSLGHTERIEEAAESGKNTTKTVGGTLSS